MIQLRWKKSSFTEEENCVEIAETKMAVRDSKNRTGPVLQVDIRPLLDAIKSEIQAD